MIAVSVSLEVALYTLESALAYLYDKYFISMVK